LKAITVDAQLYEDENERNRESSKKKKTTKGDKIEKKVCEPE